MTLNFTKQELLHLLKLAAIADRYDDIFAADGLLNVVIADKDKDKHQS